MNILLNNNNNTLYHNYDIIPKTSFVNLNNSEGIIRHNLNNSERIIRTTSFGCLNNRLIIS